MARRIFLNVRQRQTALREKVEYVSLVRWQKIWKTCNYAAWTCKSEIPSTNSDDALFHSDKIDDLAKWIWSFPPIPSNLSVFRYHEFGRETFMDNKKTSLPITATFEANGRKMRAPEMTAEAHGSMRKQRQLQIHHVHVHHNINHNHLPCRCLSRLFCARVMTRISAPYLRRSHVRFIFPFCCRWHYVHSPLTQRICSHCRNKNKHL